MIVTKSPESQAITTKSLLLLSLTSSPIKREHGGIDMVTKALMISKGKPGILIHILHLDTLTVDRDCGGPGHALEAEVNRAISSSLGLDPESEEIARIRQTLREIGMFREQ